MFWGPEIGEFGQRGTYLFDSEYDVVARNGKGIKRLVHASFNIPVWARGKDDNCELGLCARAAAYHF